MRPAQVFISYRRDDTAGYARAICDELATHFGADRVFIDVDDIQPGQRFAQVIQHEVGAATVLLVLIGRRWRGERDGAPPRIEDATDFVRREVAAGLASTARVIRKLALQDAADEVATATGRLQEASVDPFGLLFYEGEHGIDHPWGREHFAMVSHTLFGFEEVHCFCAGQWRAKSNDS